MENRLLPNSKTNSAGLAATPAFVTSTLGGVANQTLTGRCDQPRKTRNAADSLWCGVSETLDVDGGVESLQGQQKVNQLPESVGHADLSAGVMHLKAPAPKLRLIEPMSAA